ncbi:nucleotide-binding alpha-beta plait domain-containing protein [Tanacetum coccineum]
MGSYRTKEDDVAKISTSVFITNFPESFSAKELFHSCKQYGHVVDSFIPTKRSKSQRYKLTQANYRLGLLTSLLHVERRKESFTKDLASGLSAIIVGRVKEFASLANIKDRALSNERSSVFGSLGFRKIKQASMDFVTEGRIAWVEIEGRRCVSFTNSASCFYEIRMTMTSKDGGSSVLEMGSFWLVIVVEMGFRYFISEKAWAGEKINMEEEVMD